MLLKFKILGDFSEFESRSNRLTMLFIQNESLAELGKLGCHEVNFFFHFDISNNKLSKYLSLRISFSFWTIWMVSLFWLGLLERGLFPDLGVDLRLVFCLVWLYIQTEER